MAVSPSTTTCGGQHCDILLQNQDQSNGILFLRNHNGTVILFTKDGSTTQRWDIFQASDGNFLIYNAGTNNILERDAGCMSNGGTYMFCVQVAPDPGAGHRTLAMEWTEIHASPLVLQNADSGARCLDDPDHASAGDRAVLFEPCNTGDSAQQWLGTS